MANPWSQAAALVAGLAALAAAPARGGSWVPVGPPGGDVRSLAADPRDPRIVYLGTADGVLYRSTDGGRRWERQHPGFPLRGMSLDELRVDSRGRLYVGYWQVHGKGGGVGLSADGGASVELLPDIAGQSVRALALSASDPDVVVAGTLEGVFRSGDGGRSWSRISPVDDPELRNVNSVAVDPTDPQVIYAGTWHLPWKTADGGRAWHPVHAGIINDSDIMTLSFDRRSPRALYATACTGIYRSSDAGLRWSRLRGVPARSRRTRSFAQDPIAPETIYAGTTEGLWTSADGGATWRQATPKDLVVNAVLALPEGLLLGTEGAGVLLSTDRGRTWEASNDGFSERLVSRLLFDRARSRILAAVRADRRHGGVLVAPAASGPWTRVGTGLEGREVLSLSLLGDEVLAGTDDGLFVSVSHCGLWARLPTVVDGMDVHPRVTDLATPSTRTILAATTRGLLRSDDAGERWGRLGLGLGGAVTALAASPAEPGVVLAATPFGVFRSDDAGATWAQVSPALAEETIRALVFLPGDGSTVLATTSAGLLRSGDHGRTWRRRGGGLPLGDITGLAIHPEGRTLFASDFTRGGIYRSDDAGETWQGLPTEGLVSPRVWALAVDPRAPARLVAAPSTGGLHEWPAAPEGDAATGSR
jgi:photosystem II stability/assembly factor-like uncharacterized protein